MSEIPYYFDTPVPSDFRKNGLFKNTNTLIFVTWAFSRCSTKSHEVLINNQKIHLKPFQFIFGRKKCSEETGLSEDAIRHQITQLSTLKYLGSAPSPTPSRFSILEWMTSSFSQINPQLNPQKLEDKQQNTELSGCMSVNAQARDNENQKEDMEDKSPLIVAKSRKTQSKVTSIRTNTLTAQLLKEGCTQEEINQALGIFKNTDPELNGTIKNYIIGIIRKQREKHEAIQAVKARNTRNTVAKRRSSKQDSLQRIHEALSVSSVSWEPEA